MRGQAAWGELNEGCIKRFRSSLVRPRRMPVAVGVVCRFDGREAALVAVRELAVPAI